MDNTSAHSVKGTLREQLHTGYFLQPSQYLKVCCLTSENDK